MSSSKFSICYSFLNKIGSKAHRLKVKMGKEGLEENRKKSYEEKWNKQTMEIHYDCWEVTMTDEVSE